MLHCTHRYRHVYLARITVLLQRCHLSTSCAETAVGSRPVDSSSLYLPQLQHTEQQQVQHSAPCSQHAQQVAGSNTAPSHCPGAASAPRSSAHPQRWYLQPLHLSHPPQTLPVPDVHHLSHSQSEHTAMATTSPVPRTFYRRVLPSPPAIHFASEEECSDFYLAFHVHRGPGLQSCKQLFASALVGGTATSFFKLIEHFRTQDEPAFCGLASLAMVLNSLAIDPRRPWKGPWRMFHERMLDCCHPLSKVAEEGVTLQQVACLARCNGAAVHMWRHNEITLEEFRHKVDTCSQTDAQYLIISYCRKTFQQTGDGHFSPIGAYHREKDLVLILDTARFKYPPHWVPLQLLYQAMEPLDPATHMPRGLLLVSQSPRPNSVLFTLDRTKTGYETVHSFLTNILPQLVQDAAAGPHLTAVAVPGQPRVEPVLTLLQKVLANVPPEAQEFLACREPEPHHEGCTEHQGRSCHPVDSIQQMLHELRAMPLFKQLQAAAALAGEHTGSVLAADTRDPTLDSRAMQGIAGAPLGLERAAMLMLMSDAETWVPLQQAPELQSLVDMLRLAPGSNVAVEVDYVTQQLREVPLLEQDSQLTAQCAMCASGGCASGR